MGKKVSVIIPSRQERFLQPTVHDIFAKARGELEVIVVHEGPVPPDWSKLQDKYPQLHTIHHPEPKGMRAAINAAAASAISRGSKYLCKLDGHVMVDEGFDVKLIADCDSDWVVVPRRLRLEPETWTIAEPDKPPYDYHYLSFPDDPNDFGGPGLNGKPWKERQQQRADIEIDEEMSSQGSGWFMHAAYFEHLELMDQQSYGPFWNEAQEIFLKAWLSGGRCMVNKKTNYSHLHKGKKYGRGYRMPEAWLKQGANFTKNWMFNRAWAKQTMPFSWLIEKFWPVPSWPDDWRSRLYSDGKEPWDA